MDGVALIGRLAPVRGSLEPQVPLAPYTWFRVGGPAEVLFQPADEDDLATFLASCPPDVPVTVIGVGSNLIVRDGGVPGVVVRLGGRGFGQVMVDARTVTAGAAVPDAVVARRAAEAGVAGLEFLRGVPGSIGGAVRMNAGCYDAEIKDVLTGAVALDRSGRRHELSRADLGFAYRTSALPPDWIVTRVTLQGTADAPAAIAARMDAITARREASQPIRERTGGSTFKNPDPALSGGRRSWQLIDEAGLRGFTIGGAQMSAKHCNFMINTGSATAADLEALGAHVIDTVRRRTGVGLDWEIRRIGITAG